MYDIFKVMIALLQSVYSVMEYIILVLASLTVVYFIHVRLFRLNSCVQVVQFKAESIYWIHKCAHKMYIYILCSTEHIINLWSHYISGYWSCTMDAGFVCAKDPMTVAILRP
jgi:hypothetical protein